MPNAHTPDDSFLAKEKKQKQKHICLTYTAFFMQWQYTDPTLSLKMSSDKKESLGEMITQVEESEQPPLFPPPNLCPPLFGQRNIRPDLGCWIIIGYGFYPKSKRKWFRYRIQQCLMPHLLSH